MLYSRKDLCSFLAILLPALLLALSVPTLSIAEDGSAARRDAMARALSTLGAGEYTAELAWWAADERGGREPGTPESVEAGDEAAREFRTLELRPMGDVVDGKRSYFQTLDRGGKQGLLPGSRLAAGDDGFTPGKDWSVFGGCTEAHIDNASVVFAGYGITAPEYDYDDYQGVDAKGKMVLILRYEPQETDPESAWKGTESTRYSRLGAKLRNAVKHGASAVLVVDGPLHHDPERDPLAGPSVRVARNGTVPVVHLRLRVARRLLAAADVTLRKLQEAIDAEARPASRALEGVQVDLDVKVGDVRKARNVLALLEGSDPRLKEEVVVVGAHYDHVGRGNYGSRTPKRRGEVHNGADDNASGTVGVLEVAEALVQGGVRPRRSILFELYDAEEKGLLGSAHYVSHPAVPLEKTVAMINLDMIGHVKKGDGAACDVSGTGSAPSWEALLKEAEKGSPLVFHHKPKGWGGSDHVSFLRKEVPSVFFCSGMFPAYHTPDDDPADCNAEGSVEILKVVVQLAELVADRDARLEFRKPPALQIARRALLGIQPGAGGGKVPGITVQGVVPGTGAQAAGIRPGDVILYLDDTRIEALNSLLQFMGARKPGDTVRVRWIRGNEGFDATAKLAPAGQ